MSGVVERGADGSLLLLIDGDLQFDSRDENIYHEGLVLPALSVASKRSPEPLRVLVIGGGDGLSARELLKSRAVACVDLVDYDPEILEMAITEFNGLNNNSLSDRRVRTHIMDAWQYVDQAIEQETVYDLIISDLTVADSVDGARLHSVDWYEKLNRLLTPGGVVAVNGASPDKTPFAYWSIFNSMCAGDLRAVPYRLVIPSFAERGYGNHWGFFLASNQLIDPAEMNLSLLAEPRSFLKEQSQLRQLFLLPDELFALQPKARPALAGSNILLQYFDRQGEWKLPESLRDSFTIATDAITIPEADTGKCILPEEVSLALAKVMGGQANTAEAGPADPELVLKEVLDAMPSLKSDLSSDLIAEFLKEPEVFLQGVDLRGLVSRLLQRAASLPAYLVAELQVLNERLKDWAGDHLSLMEMGAQVVTLVTLILVIGNLLYPDMVYAKGTAGHAGYAGGTYYNGVGGTNVYNRRTIIQQPARKVIVPGAKTITPGPKSALPTDRTELLGTLRDVSATVNVLTVDRSEAANYSQVLRRELEQYKLSKDDRVLFGTRLMPRDEAMRLTELAIVKTELKTKLLDARIAQLQADVDLAQTALKQSDPEA